MDEPINTPAPYQQEVSDPASRKAAIEIIRRGPIGALVVASIAVACVLIIWFAFYFFAYVPRT
jgi:hypothetical protein